jgi:Tfp pilus assembly protein PilN
MPQQVNLCLPLLRQQKKRFAAQTLAQALALILIVSGVLGAAWIWNLNQASTSLKATLEAQAKELDGLRAVLDQNKASAAPAQDALALEIKRRKAELEQREKVLAALSQGVFQPGKGHAARLQLVAQTIPAVAWITQIRADDRQLEVTGYTLEPSALNDWVAKLADSPLLKGQALSTVKVESAKPESLQPVVIPTAQQAAAKPENAASMATAVARPALPPLWSFNLLSSMAATTPVAVGQP